MRWHEEKVADEAVAAAVRGGFKILEFTSGTTGYLNLIKKYSKIDGVIVGAGTVLTPK